MRKNTLKSQQNGMVSILVTMFMMIVISLLVISFARIIRREQREVLDRQLSTQAFYAAESGVNDAIALLKSNPTAAATPKTDCANSAPYDSLNSKSTLDATAGVSYTCVLVDPLVDDLQYQTIDQTTSTVIPVKASGGNISNITISWQAADDGATNFSCPAAPSLPAAGGWTCDPGILRIDLVPGTALDRTSLINNTMTVLLYPQNSGTSNPTVNYASYTGNNGGGIIATKCVAGSTPRACQTTISVPAASSYYMHVKSLYKNNALTVQAQNNLNSPLQLTGAQAQIDATGKANDVLRRVVVRVNTAGNYDGIPEFAIQSKDSICKRFYTYSGSSTVDTAGISGPDLGACQLN